mgnify:FL=1
MRSKVQAARRLVLRGMREITGPRPSVLGGCDLRHLGTPYGGWYFLADPQLFGGQIISCGAGEDISFDVELASVYGASVLIVDPTPRAVTHVEDALSHIGQQRVEPYRSGGCQPVSAYDLSRVRSGQIRLQQSALAASAGKRAFFAPQDSTHVSFSLTDWQSGRTKSGHSIEVECVTYRELCAEVGVTSPVLVKLDIEGAEHEVIPQLLAKPPRQLLVEFDELALGDKKSHLDWKASHSALIEYGFHLVKVDGLNYTYASGELLRDLTTSDSTNIGKA